MKLVCVKCKKKFKTYTFHKNPMCNKCILKENIKEVEK